MGLSFLCLRSSSTHLIYQKLFRGHSIHTKWIKVKTEEDEIGEGRIGKSGYFLRRISQWHGAAEAAWVLCLPWLLGVQALVCIGNSESLYCLASIAWLRLNFVGIRDRLTFI